MEFNSASVDLMNINCRIIWIRYRCGNCPYFLLHAEDAFVCHRIPLLGIVCYWMKPVYGQWRWITLTPACKGENSTKGKLLYWNNTVQYVCIYKETSQLIYFFVFLKPRLLSPNMSPGTRWGGKNATKHSNGTFAERRPHLCLSENIMSEWEEKQRVFSIHRQQTVVMMNCSLKCLHYLVPPAQHKCH